MLGVLLRIPSAELSAIGFLVFTQDPWAALNAISVCLVHAEDPSAELSTIKLLGVYTRSLRRIKHHRVLW